MKLERLISMIYMLLNNEVLSASALAEKYKVSQRTIYRDIDAICAAGIPVVSFQGVNGGYGIMDSYKMDKSLLGSYDVSSLITILHSMSTVFDDERALETIHKLQTLQHGEASPSLTMDIGGSGAYNDSLRILRVAITECRVVRFEYVNAKSERKERCVEPISLLYKYDSWYLYGFCRERKDFREFKLPRMANLLASAEYFQKHSRLPERGNRYDDAQIVSKVKVMLHFSIEYLARAMDFYYSAEKTFNEDGTLTMTLEVDTWSVERWLIPSLLSFGDGVIVVEPAEVRDRVKASIEKMLKRYSEV
ncbi:YafY family protein [Bacillus sp. FJAT-26390]|uniref:helix-turn-helix transcriptional regulator n=1 Tax=Bacillus sp. FJAT-26390 TaxID=1743142 RepID=UPI000807EDC8|nr:YafY family protein [Bacillus sp. FJAT-26390]OBZ17260.1 transcriptional regulator [Bacillus sp. FJAT-26390]